MILLIEKMKSREKQIKKASQPPEYRIDLFQQMIRKQLLGNKTEKYIRSFP